MQNGGRRVVPAMRWVFVVGSVLVATAAFQLFVLTHHTDRFFAWTIAPGLSATLPGAFYVTALVLAAGSVREHEWARTRVGVFGVWVLYLAFPVLVVATGALGVEIQRGG